MRAVVAVAMPKLCKAMRAAVAKQADDGFICYVFYVAYVGYVAAHRGLAERFLGPCGALRRRCSRRTFPVMAVKAVFVDAQASRGRRRSVHLGYVSYVLYVSYAAPVASITVLLSEPAGDSMSVCTEGPAGILPLKRIS